MGRFGSDPWVTCNKTQGGAASQHRKEPLLSGGGAEKLDLSWPLMLKVNILAVPQTAL